MAVLTDFLHLALSVGCNPPLYMRPNCAVCIRRRTPLHLRLLFKANERDVRSDQHVVIRNLHPLIGCLFRFDKEPHTVNSTSKFCITFSKAGK